MLKHLFKKTAKEPPPPVRLDDLVKVYVQRYCLEQHIRLKLLMEKMERDIIFQVLEATHGNQRSAAQMLGLKPNTLHYKIRRMGIVPVRKYAILDSLLGLTEPQVKPGLTPPKAGGQKLTEH